MYPSYKHVTIAKETCYPVPWSLEITEKSVVITLQDLLNHTSERIIKILLETSLSLSEEEKSSLSLTLKYGCDGTSGLSRYKQNFDNFEDSDESIFIMSIVPLVLEVTSPLNTSKVIWKNDRASSTRHCRPIRFYFEKES